MRKGIVQTVFTLIVHTLLGLGFIAIAWQHTLGPALAELIAKPYSWDWFLTAWLTAGLVAFAMSLLYVLAAGVTEAVFDRWAAKTNGDR